MSPSVAPADSLIVEALTTALAVRLERIERIVELISSRSEIVAPRLLDMAEAARYTGRSLSAMRHMVSKGAVPITRIDEKVQFDRLALDKLIGESTHWPA